jgi:hypothetical protein
VSRTWRVYVSGPVTGMPRSEARALFKAACLKVELAGHIAINPLDIPHPDNCGCEQPIDGSHNWECALRKDIRVLINCDAILMLPGWMHSEGAELERYIARRLCIPIYLSSADLPVVNDATKCPRCGDTSRLLSPHWGICAPCVTAEGWDRDERTVAQ